MKIAAIVYDAADSQLADEHITELARKLKEQGYNLAGAVQSNPAMPNRNRCDIMLEDLASGRIIKASQDRGALASGCRLDSGALEESVGLAWSAVGPEIDFIVVNRFGRQESEGRGFRSMIEQGVVMGIPVVAGLNRLHLDAWCGFVGQNPVLLPLKADAIMDWCASQVSHCL